jgi:hypothetical protein
MWKNLEDLWSNVCLNESSDMLDGVFTVKSLYYYLMASTRVKLSYKFLWALKIHLGIKVLCWLVVKNRVLTRDNLKKKGWKGTELC